jgi:arginine/lysine/ornithine decarboxylase
MDLLEKPEDYFGDYVENLKDFYEFSGQLKHLEILTADSDKKDMGKLVISTKHTNITGVELAAILRKKYKLETELSSFSYVLAMTSIMDTKEGFERLKMALAEIDRELEEGSILVPYVNLKPVKRMEPWQAKVGNTMDTMLYTAKGRTSCDMICLYPPATPVIVPGEEVTEEAIKVIDQAMDLGIHVTGLKDGHLSVVN